jgi:hypothetical protein
MIQQIDKDRTRNRVTYSLKLGRAAAAKLGFSRHDPRNVLAPGRYCPATV